MDDLPAMLERDFGLRPQGRSAPMSATRSRSAQSPPLDPSSFTYNRSRSSYSSASDAINSDELVFDDVFGGPPLYSTASTSVDALHDGRNESTPVYDKPLYDDDIFDGLPGVKSASSSARFNDVFATMPSVGEHSSPPIDDIFESLGKVSSQSSGSSRRRPDEPRDQVLPGFEELIPGFGGSSSLLEKRRDPAETNQNPLSASSKSFSSMNEDPFVVLGTSHASENSTSSQFSDPLEQFSKLVNSGSPKTNTSSVTEGLFDGLDRLEKLAPSVASELNDGPREKNSLKSEHGKAFRDPFADLEVPLRSSVEAKHRGIDNNHELNEMHFSNLNKSSDPLNDVSNMSIRSPDRNSVPYKEKANVVLSSTSQGSEGISEDVWLSIGEIPLFTKPTSAPSPSRPPPPLAYKHGQTRKGGQGTSVGSYDGRKSTNPFVQTSQTYSNTTKNSRASSIDELSDFAMGEPQTNSDVHSGVSYKEEEFEKNFTAAASEAAMKEAMDRAEAKIRLAKEVREKERDAKSVKTRESGPELDTRFPASRDVGYNEQPEVLDQEQEQREERLNREREQRDREAKEKEERRREEEREQERERERVRIAVEMATREARERAATEARLKAEKAAVERANAEARQRAERLAVQRAAAEARERAQAEAKERAAAAKAAAEAKERAAARERDEREASEAKERAARERAEAAIREKAASERAAVERATQEARKRAESAAVERANQEARERAAAAAARERQQKYENENDLESIFGMGSRANSAPKQRAASSENMFNVQGQNRGTHGSAHGGNSRSTSANIKRPSSVTAMDDLTDLFGGAPSSNEFQEFNDETEERRKHRLMREERTRERAAKALAEKNERDMQTKREQEERHRYAESLDAEIRRWAAGKEGNMRALLSTLQYILWPELGWEPVSLTDLITPIAVKAKYRKATLCVHPDKVQQKGATLQQKYIAEKVFDLLKEAWNKFNSEELF